MIQKIILGSILLVVTVTGAIAFLLPPRLPIINGYAAKKMCACTFIAGRTQKSIQRNDLNFSLLQFSKTKIDKVAKTATSRFFGMGAETAYYMGDAGCVLIKGENDFDTKVEIDRPKLSEEEEWPLGDKVVPINTNESFNKEQLIKAVDKAFSKKKKTNAVVVIHKGKIVYEQYADGYDFDTEVLGWSMTKNITSTVTGILVKNNQLSLNDKNLLPEWTDGRRDISLEHLLQMESGLAFVENYASVSDVTNMLYATENTPDIPLTKELEHPPGTHWYYNSGTSNIVQRIIQNKLPTVAEYHALHYDSLLFKLGMSSAVLEMDEGGNFIGSSYLYATPRDWGKFGLLYLQEGNWFGEQIIDTSWVDFAKRPSPNSDGLYGGHFWLNTDKKMLKDVPETLYTCSGFQGQRVYILPEQDMVVVRMGLGDFPYFNHNVFIRDILASIEPKS